MLNAPIGVLALGMLAALLHLERREERKLRLVVKTLLSCLFVAAALVQPEPLAPYFYMLVPGLVLCLVGDVCLALPRDRAFLAGLVSFLLGHVMYIAAFASVTRVGPWTLPGLGVFALASTGVFLWLRPHLGSMTWPVLAYVIVITAMVTLAWSVLVESGTPLTGRCLIFAGALLFYLSDVTVARDRFVREQFANRLVGLPLYYAGQFLLAFSAGSL